MSGILTLVLFLGICFAMHFFMHRGHGHGGGHQHGEQAADPQRSSADDETSAKHRKHAGHGCH